MKRANYLAVAAACFATYSSAQADSFQKQCGEVQDCAQAVADLLGQKYVFDNDIKGQFSGTSNLEMTKENAELLFTNALNANGFARVPLGTPGSYQIMRQRDARDQPLPLIDCERTVPPALPETWDLVTIRYHATNPERVEDIARTSRSFMPANSRIIPDIHAGRLLVTDTAMNIAKLYSIIRDLDQPARQKGR